MKIDKDSCLTLNYAKENKLESQLKNMCNLAKKGKDNVICV